MRRKNFTKKKLHFLINVIYVVHFFVNMVKQFVQLLI